MHNGEMYVPAKDVNDLANMLETKSSQAYQVIGSLSEPTCIYKKVI